MLRFEERRTHVQQSTLEGRQPAKRPSTTIKKVKADKNNSTHKTQQQSRTTNLTKGKSAAKTQDKNATKPAGGRKQPRSVASEAVVLTKTQLQEILAAAGLHKEESNDDERENKQSDSDGWREETPKGGSEDVLVTLPRDTRSPLSPNPQHHGGSTSLVSSPTTRKPNGDSRSISTAPSTNPGSSGTTYSPPGRKMSLIEQKRLQWAREKAQMQVNSEWSPWGRPGCGAPMTVGTGNRMPIDWNIANKGSTQSIRLAGNGESGRTLLLPPLPQTNSVPKKLPSALRSSLTLSYSPGSDAVYISAKEEERRKWLEELDRQREEQRLRRLLEQDSLQSSQTGSDRLSVSSPSPPSRTPVSLPLSFSPTLPPVAEHGLDSLNNSPIACMETVTIQRSFMRGANVPLDADTKADLEKKRQKQREQQLAIEAQLEEKQRRLEEEKRRLQMEERREDERITREQQMMEQQKLMEENKFRQVKSKRTVSATDITATLDSEPSSPHNQQVPTYSEETAPEVQVDPPPSPQPLVSDETIEPVEGVVRTEQRRGARGRVASPYTENRVLTPTKYRGYELGSYPPRECGTQTDSSLPRKKDVGIDADGTGRDKDPSRSSRSDGKNGKKKNDANNNNNNEANRPKWGSNHTEKFYVKQSEKDPKYESSRRRLQEMRRKRLEQEAVIQCSQPLVGTRSSAKHQRQLLAKEVNSPMTHRSGSPVLYRHSSAESPYLDDGNLESAVRRQRRQWDSPRTDEIPNFYTQPHQLPARRNSRSSTRSVTTGTPDGRSPLKANHDIYVGTPMHNNNGGGALSSWNSVTELRTQSPPVPAIRNRVQSLENVHLTVDDSSTTERPSMPPVEESKSQFSTNMDKIVAEVSSLVDEDIQRRKSNMSASSRYSTENDGVYRPSQQRSLNLIENHPNPSAGNKLKQQWPQRSKILEQLSAIRQGLFKKQQELEAFLNVTEDSSKNDKMFKS